jgi:outer membrane protein insertion porin family
MVQGNTTTRTALVQRLAGLDKTPQPADVGRIHEAPQLLRRSGLFATVGEPVLYRIEGSERIGVVLPVVESQHRHSIFGVLGFARDPGRSGPYLTGAIDLGLRNIYGSGRDLALAWRRDARTGSRLAAGYQERFFLGSPFDLSADLSQTVRDSTSTWQTLDLGVSLPVRRNVALDFGGALDRSVYHMGVQGNTLRWRTRLGVRLATLGREDEGQRFGTFELHGEYARRRNDLVVAGVSDHAEVGQTLYGGRFEVGWPVAMRHVFAARGEWHGLETDALPVPESELYEFGGAQTVRGYREGQFRGDRIAFGGLEYRFGHPRGARLYGFVDAGAFTRRLGPVVSPSAFKVGYGAGLRAAVATGLFDLAFGLGDEGHSLSAVKLHVTLLQRF